MEDREYMKQYLLRKIEIVDECWIFKGCKNAKEDKGYGIVSHKGKTKLAHRLSYEIYKGEIPKGMYVLHNCPIEDNRTCCNPDHLWLGTYKQNSIDAAKKGTLRGWQYRKKTKEEIEICKKNLKVILGEKHGMSKFKKEEIIEMRKLMDKEISYKEISDKFGINIRSIADIKFRRTWKHI